MMSAKRPRNNKPPSEEAATRSTAEPEKKRTCLQQQDPGEKIPEQASALRATAGVPRTPAPQHQRSQETSHHGDFNIVLPTLIQQLKSILDLYQDDGQILKELIQNAEDASASTIKFLLDERSFKSELLHHPELSKFQGPALYAYNDALFNENDWMSLSKWANSVKKHEPTKIGRFGLGFKSVFHITDLPMIMSGYTVCAIDPQERYFTKDDDRRSGYKWLINADADIIKADKDQFEPLRNIFDENTGPFESEKCFEGTLFRFPLRQTPSKICDNIYDAEKVRRLFTSFQTAAEQMLVFLMSLERIELYVREASAKKPTLVFCVNVRPQIVPGLRLKRQDFLDQVKSINHGAAESDMLNKEVSLTSLVILEQFAAGVKTTEFNSSSTYLVSHYCGWASSGESNQQLAASKKLSYLPWASTAAMLFPSSEIEPLDWMATCPKPRGQLFCFLPLPLQDDSPTGLPVHVNGFFALSSSRHEVKWPSINDSDTSDDSCQWNKYLLENVVPRAYANMVLELIRKVASGSEGLSCSPDSSDELKKTTRHVAYSLFPDLDAVVDRWQGMLSPFYSLIFKESVVFVHTEGGGKWVQPNVTWIPDLDEEWRIREATARCLADAGLPDVAGAASVPLHVLKAMQQQVSPPPRLTPTALRTALKRTPLAINNMSDDDRLAILEFILKADDRCYQELFGLPLVPLVSGTFTTFANDVESTRVYVASNEHPQSLLPRSAGLFLDLSDRITKPLKKMLTAVANSKKTNICLFNEHHFKTLCRSMVTSENVIQCHYAEVLWDYLCKYFAESLSEFEGLPFLLSCTESPSENCTSHQLCRGRPLLTAQCDGDRLNENVLNALRCMGVEVVSNVAPFIWSHAKVRSVYVFPPSPMGVLEVLCISKREGRMVPKNLAQLKASERVALLKELDRLDHRRQFTDTQVDLLKSLPLFEIKGQSEMYASAAEVNEAAPLLDHPPLPPHCRLLDAKASSQALISTLGIRSLGRAELFERYLKPAIQQTDCPRDYIDLVMTDVLRNLNAYEQENPSFIALLSSLQFVSRQDGKRVAPSQAFDLHDALLSDIVFGQKLYPSSPYDQEINMAPLRRLGLIDIERMTVQQLLECTHNVSTLLETQCSHSKENIIKKSIGILKYLEDRSDQIGEETVEHLNDCNWIIPLTTPPEGYPSELPWFGRNQNAVSPANIYDVRYATVVGSCSAVLPRSVKRSLLVKFKWNKPPPLEAILKHLQNVVGVYRLSEKANFLPIVCRVYEILQKFDDAEFQESLSKTTMKKWIWQGEGFAQPRYMVLKGTDIDFKPYIHVVPNETQKYKSFFIRTGVHKELNHSLLLDVLHKINERHTSNESPMDKRAQKSDHQLSVKIVHELAASWDSLPADAKSRLIIPTAKENLTLLPVEACTYSTSKWLNELHSQATSDEENSVTFVHPDIDAEVAEKLGVPSLSSRLIDSEDFEIGEGFGQAESLTTRLNRLLRDYADGLAVPKELIQNADDAGATEVQFVYDERCNKNYRTCLIDDGMRECQGPALWVYNNSTFSDRDFRDIIRISNPEKAERSDRIGGFGLGFNAVYNLTDVPSFLSREFLVIFDPHKYHLGKSLPDSNQPGIKLNLQKNKKILRTFRNQFLPYDGICGCNIISWLDNVANFNGTLFRLPLRTPSQASKSEISSKPYDNKEVAKLFEMLAEACHTVLLFTQNVISVSVLHIPDGGNPRTPRMLFKVTKKLIRVVRMLQQPVPLSDVACHLSKEDKDLVTNANILRAAANAKVNFNSSSKQLPPTSSVLLKIHFEKDDENCLNLPLSLSGSDTTAWLVVCSMGEGNSLKLAMENRRLSPTGGVAAKVSLTDDGSLIQPINLLNEGGELLGHIFCYLPLPLRSQLPVHINGAFALHSSRRALMTTFGEDKSNDSALWNKYLMEDVIAKAYVILLEDLRDMHPLSSTVSQMETDITHAHSSYSYYDLWPIQGRASADCEPLVDSFYVRLADKDASLRLFNDGYQWASLRKSFMLDGDMRSKPEIAKAAVTALRAFIKEHYPSQELIVVDLPSEIRNGFVNVKHHCLLEQQTYGIVEFFSNILTIISGLPCEVRDTLILFALDTVSQNEELREVLVARPGTPCIPVTPCGRTLKSINQLVNPKSRIACLYSADDGRFPFGNEETYLNDRRLFTLAKLGMLDHELTEEELVACASRCLSLYDPNDEHAHMSACLRASTLLNIIEERLENRSQSLSNIKTALCSAKFLPYISSKSLSTLKWKGDTVITTLLSPSELYLPVHRSLLCYVEALLDEKSLIIRGFSKTKKFLEMDRKVPLDAVLRQLNFVTENRHELVSSHDTGTNKIMSSIYNFLQENLEEAVNELTYAEKTCYIMVEDDFVQPQKVCVESLKIQYAPYLYHLPRELQKYQTLFKRLGMKDTFTAVDVASALEEMNAEHKDVVLDDQRLATAVNLAQFLYQKLQHLTEKCNFQSPIYLPDTHKILRLASDLSFDDCPWLSDDADDDDLQLVHGLIPYNVAQKLGVRTMRESTLQRHHLGIPFGQKEELVSRIARIMTAYPRGKEIFYELLQNADDAGATEIHFIKDYRHHPTQKVFEDSWKPLQGPSLCVFNNKSFSQRDLEGIQSLGTGSKSRDPFKTGQYGVGFNSVYHLTDVPSFITTGEEVGEVLCVLDPHCLYVPGATEGKPGRQYTKLEKLRKKFPDVFSCYLEDLMPLNEGTLFRFPLRTSEMSSKSRLCSSELTAQELDQLLENFKSEMFEVLLFVNNLTQIKISEVSRDGKARQNMFTVQATLSMEDTLKRNDFQQYVRQCSAGLKAQKLRLRDIEMRQICYSVVLEDSNHHKESWRVIQRFGFKSNYKIHESIEKSFASGELCLLPRGGVAGLISSASSIGHPDRKRRVYCFLPLPLKTDLPVHMNGHFALDYESRRGVWLEDEGGGFRTEWNLALLEEVIAPAYIDFLKDTRDKISDNWCKEKRLCRVDEALQTYFQQFPSVPKDWINIWSRISVALYKTIHRDQDELLPLLKTDKNRQCVEDMQWLPLITDICEKATFFDDTNDKDQQKIKDLLIRAGMRWIHDPMNLAMLFEDSGVTVLRLNPENVIDFIRSKDFKRPEPLPCVLEKTIFFEKSAVVEVAKYCLKDARSFWSKADGLPLGLSHANKLHAFSSMQPLFSSEYHELLPPIADDFLHKAIRKLCGCIPKTVCGNVVYDRAVPQKLLSSQSNDSGKAILVPAIFKNFSVSDLAAGLHLVLDQRFRCQDNAPVPWDYRSSTLPDPVWLSLLWRYLSAQPNANTKKHRDSDETTNGELLHQMVECLSQWALVPALKEADDTRNRSVPLRKADSVRTHYLVSIQNRKMVVDFTSTTKTKKDDTPVKEALNALEVLKLDAEVLKTNYEGHSLVKQLITNLANPTDVLESVHCALRFSTENQQKLVNRKHCRSLLEYFSTKLPTKESANFHAVQTNLRRLPFYETHKGDLSVLHGRDCAILQADIPSDDFDIWSNSLPVLLLKRGCMPESLGIFLECQYLDADKVYYEIIFPKFSHLSANGRKAHLKYVRDEWLQKSWDNQGKERTNLLNRLKELAFLDKGDGHLQTASCFYDPRNELLEFLWNPDRFPPKEYKLPEWLEFLVTIGMRRVPVNHDFIDLAQNIARKSMSLGMEKLKKLAQLLVKQLFESKNLDWTTLRDIRQIPFICGSDVTSVLSELGISCDSRFSEPLVIKFDGAVSSSKINIYCSWSTAEFLPDWANPSLMYSLEFKYDEALYKNSDAYRSFLLRQLGILTAPSEKQIAEHVQNLVQPPQENTPKLEASMLDEVMHVIYAELQKRIPLVMNDTFKNMPCILLKDTGGNPSFVQASQLVLNMSLLWQVRPYIMKAPQCLASFGTLLTHLGAAKETSVELYASLLTKLHVKYKGLKLTPEDVTASHQAVRCLVSHILSTEEITLREMYLPSSDGCLYSSYNLIYNDYSAFAERLKSSSFNEPFLVDLNLCGVTIADFEDAIRKMPEVLRPRLLFNVVEERLIEPNTELGLQEVSVPPEQLQTLLQSELFHEGLWRLVWQEHIYRGSKPSDEIRRKLEKALRSIEVRRRLKLVTYLTYKGRRMEGSERETDDFVSRLGTGTEQERYIIYTEGSGPLSMMSYIRVAEIIDKMSEGILRRSLLYLHPMLQCEPSNIEHLLDKLRITTRGSRRETLLYQSPAGETSHD